MVKYPREWVSIDPGNEALWYLPAWLKVLQIIAQHEGEDVYDDTAPIYQALKAALPDATWMSYEGGKFRPLFRDYSHPWTRTGTLDISDKKFHLTTTGRDVVRGILSPADVFVLMFKAYTENSESPFQVLAKGFRDAGRPLSLEQVYYGIVHSYRAGDEIEKALDVANGQPDPPPNPKRRLKLMLRLLEQVGALGANEKKTVWVVANGKLLDTISQPATHTATNFWKVADEAAAAFGAAKLIISPSLVRRYSASLLAKRFVILSGLSGSGKTQLAIAFARWLTRVGEPADVAVVTVGADWTSTDHIVGYPDALDASKYVRTGALDLIIRAHQNSAFPYFLILDEMNLSHVERYFADILSVIESDEYIRLHSDIGPRDGIPPTIKLPKNLFIVGTINVDETTYLFSPKVLDRSNVLEFRVSQAEMANYLKAPQKPDLDGLAGAGAGFGADFAAQSQASSDLTGEDRQLLQSEIDLLFELLEKYGAEFGYRTALEIDRFAYFFGRLSAAPELQQAIDCQIVQKVLPKVNGSRRKVEPVLCALGSFCFETHDWSAKAGGGGRELRNRTNLLDKALRAGALLDDTTHPLALDDQEQRRYPVSKAFYPLSFKKILRMLTKAEEGFTSFAEA